MSTGAQYRPGAQEARPRTSHIVKRSSPGGRRGRWVAAAFLLPAVLALFAVGIYPLIFALQVSMRQYQLARPGPFIGLANYQAVLSDPSFWDSLGRTFFFLLLALPLQVIIGLLVALLLQRPRFTLLRGIVRVALVVPLATAPAAIGLIGRLIFNREFGVANYALSFLGIGPLEWLSTPGMAFTSILLMDTWQWTPFATLVFLAGFATVPTEIEEAASLETDSWFRILRHIHLPYLLPGLTAVLILRTADIMKLFDMVFVMTRGGPGSATELVSLYIQRIGFRVFNQGLASAQAVLLLILTIVLSRLFIRVFYREVDV